MPVPAEANREVCAHVGGGPRRKRNRLPSAKFLLVPFPLCYRIPSTWCEREERCDTSLTQQGRIEPVLTFLLHEFTTRISSSLTNCARVQSDKYAHVQSNCDSCIRTSHAAIPKNYLRKIKFRVWRTSISISVFKVWAKPSTFLLFVRKFAKFASAVQHHKWVTLCTPFATSWKQKYYTTPYD